MNSEIPFQASTRRSWSDRHFFRSAYCQLLNGRWRWLAAERTDAAVGGTGASMRSAANHTIHRVVTTLAVLVILLFAARDLPAQTDKPESPPAAVEVGVTPTPSLHDAFSKLLSGSTLRGHFTVDGQTEGLKEELYQIQRVTKLPSGDMWLFNVRIRYGDHDVTVPLPLKVQWAGQTPMIVVDHVTIPGMGTFDARVLLADRRYAGTWQHGDVGGHLFGTIVPAEQAAKDAQEKPDVSDPPESGTP